MRAGIVAIASALAFAAACASFATDEAVGAGSSPSSDAGKSDQTAPVVTKEGGANANDDAGASALPADAFDDIAFDPATELDQFERADPIGGPLKWQSQKVATSATVIGSEDCDDALVCSKNLVAYCENNIQGWGFLVAELDPEARVMRLDFAMKIALQTHAAGAQGQVVSIALDTDRFIFLTDDQGTLRLGDQYRPNAVDADYDTKFTDLGPVPDADGWAKYRLYVDLDLRLVALMKDGAPLGPPRVLRPEVITKLATLRIGVTYARGDNFHVAIDNVGLRKRYR